MRPRFGRAAGHPAVPALGAGLRPGSTYGQRLRLPAVPRGSSTVPALGGLFLRGPVVGVSTVQAYADNVRRGGR